MAKLPGDHSKDKTYSEQNFNPITAEEVLLSVENAYYYLKAYSDLECWQYMEMKKPAFDLIFLLAPSIIGRGIQEGVNPKKDLMGGMSSITE